jgi:hypothetical protein
MNIRLPVRRAHPGMPRPGKRTLAAQRPMRCIPVFCTQPPWAPFELIAENCSLPLSQRVQPGLGGLLVLPLCSRDDMFRDRAWDSSWTSWSGCGAWASRRHSAKIGHDPPYHQTA